PPGTTAPPRTIIPPPHRRTHLVARPTSPTRPTPRHGPPRRGRTPPAQPRPPPAGGPTRRWGRPGTNGPARHEESPCHARTHPARTSPPHAGGPPTGRVSHAQARLAGVCGPAGRELGAAKDAMAAVAFRAGSSDGGGRRGRRSLTAERGVVWQSAFFTTNNLRGKGGLLVGAGQAGLARALDRRVAYSAASASESYFWRGQKKPRSPSFRFRGTTWTCRWGTLWLTRLFSATNEPAAPSTDSIADASRCACPKNGPSDSPGRSVSVS